jgi:uncharacterized membrane protein
VTLESSRTLGGVGALLIFLGSAFSFLSLVRYVYPSLSLAATALGGLLGVLSFTGLILFMVAMNGLANHYRDRAIFNNALYWIITSIVGAVVAIALAVAVTLSVLSSIIKTIAPFTPTNPPSISSLLDALRPFIVYFIPVGVVAFAIGVISVVFIMRAFNRLASASGVRIFRLFLAGIAVTGALELLAALLILTSSITFSAVLPLIAVSGLVNVTAWVLATTAFFRIRAPTSPPVPQTTPQTVTPAAGQAKYCPHCGAENLADATYCVRCGQKL